MTGCGSKSKFASASRAVWFAAVLAVLGSAPFVRADNVGGAWLSPDSENWPLIPIHAALTSDGKVLTFGTDGTGRQTGFFTYDLWDPAAGLSGGHTTLDNRTGTDVFCSAQLMLPQDGSILIAGGDNWNGTSTTNVGNRNSSLYANGTLTRATAMNRPRWCSSATVLSSGEIYVQGGAGGEDRPEVRDLSGAFRVLSGADTSSLQSLHPRNFLAPDGRVFGYDASGVMYFVDANGSGRRTIAGQLQSVYAGLTSSAAMYRPGRILQLGGNSNRAAIIDISGPNPVVTATQSMSSQRQWVTATVLADGRVVATGGSAADNQLTDVNTSAEIWDPATGTWTVGASGLRARLYHSTALLLPDASVLVAGGGAPGPLANRNAEIYLPPYLFNAAGDLAPRPRIMAGPDRLQYGQDFLIDVDSARVSKVTLVKVGAVTHGFNMDQRFLEMSFNSANGLVFSRAPMRATDAPPGYYLLFVIDVHGVPSVAKIVQIGAATTAVKASVAAAAALVGPESLDSFWDPSVVPTVATSSDTGSVQLGVKFRASVDGYVTGIRFYKGAGNTGTHVGSLWSSAGVRLALATFTSETATGWQQVTFAQPVAVTANTVYVASYHAPNGGYSYDRNFFTSAGLTVGPLYLLRDGESGGNGVYAYGTSGTFPSGTYQSTNYWVDVVFEAGTPAPDTTPPTVSTRTPASGATGVAVGTVVTATFSEALDPATVNAGTFELRDGSSALVAASVSYNAAGNTATLTPSASLLASTTYTATVRGGATDPRIKDVAGNALAANASWSFTTAVAPAPDTTPPTVSTRTPASGATGVAVGTVVTATFSEALDPATVNAGTFELRDGSSALVAASVSYNAAGNTATLTPSASLLASTTYTATVRGGATDPRIKDVAGNALAANASWSFTTADSVACSGNPTVTENCLPGSPQAEWDVVGAGDSSIQGFATEISVNRGDAVFFKIKSTAANYRLDIYRLGYYGGLGARKVATVTPSATLPQVQPNCLVDSSTGLVDCGNWAVSASWVVPTNATSGIYIARLVRSDTSGASHIVFVVRDDAGSADVLFQTADTTWQAYNTYGGNSLYQGAPVGRAYAVSYNRPFATRGDKADSWLFNAEYPMLRWLEANGYNVSYTTGVDTDRRGSLLGNHRVFMSNGHDEYWSAQQRSNVEAARDAGLHLAFFSGNEVFWKTRWQNSIDGSATPYRTLVCYKETHANAKVDPSPAWTGTWRDPRFSPPADGGRPENALTGTLYMVNDGGTASIVVPDADGRMRFWRNTSVATLASGTSATLPFGTLGYEWNVEPDNGFRPAGLIRLSSTTVSGVPVLQDYGTSYASGTASHSLTLYKASSGALVFGAGTVQWAWGLDAVHDRGAGTPVDGRMRQATVNLLADMGVQPAGLQAGLVVAVASTDNLAPVSMITAPAAGGTLQLGAPVAIVGTASENGGGQVGGVEVSADGGATWRRANGRGSWTYNWTPSTLGQVTLRSRATDDSGNVESAASGVTLTVSSGGQACPCSAWSSGVVPTVATSSDTGSVQLGVKFRASVDGYVTGIRFYKGAGNTGTHVGSLWSSAGVRLALATFTSETATGWQQVTFAQPVAVTANTVYVASYHAPNGGYSYDRNFFTSAGLTVGPLYLLRDGESGGNGVYAYGMSGTFPSGTYQSTNYWVDVVFEAGTPAPDTTPPTVSTRTPASGATGVAVGTVVTATFSEALDPATVNAGTFELRDGSSALVAASVSYNAAGNTATLTPSASLLASTTYTATVRGGATDPRIKDVAGNALAASASWSFTTAVAPAPDTTPPTVSTRTPASGATGVAVGTVVTATFSEALDPATVNAGTFELRDGSSALVAASVSYNAAGNTATLTPSASLLASTTYTATVRGGATDPRIKDVAGNALAANASWSFTTAVAPAPDTTPPTVSTRTPASGATGVAVGTVVTATFSEALDPATVNAGTFELRDGSSALVAASVSYNAAGNTATLTPSASLLASTTYTATVRGGATDPRIKDVAGNALAASASWSFTTAVPSACPCSAWSSGVVPTVATSSDTGSVELGVKFRASVDGYVTGIRFYKGAGNTGTHVGSLWSSAGVRLALATFTSETATGWQQVTFAQPVAVTANTVYVASYHAPNGGYSYDRNFFTSAGLTVGPLYLLRDGESGGNGVYAYGTSGTFPSGTYQSTNYWVDVVFEAGTPAPDTTPPTVSTRTPASGATGVAVGTVVTATFSEALDPATVNAGTFELRDGSSALVAASVSYNAAGNTATLTPSASLLASTTYTATVRGGATDPRIKDVAGNALAASASWSFTTAVPSACPCSAWSSGVVPTVATSSDTGSVELGVKFRASVDGYVTGVRFYKGAGNAGTHVGSLWSSAGVRLASATFTSETATGWQQVTFAQPVAVTANTVYVASYHAPNGGYSYDRNFFTSAGLTVGPLYLLRDGESGGNGVYAYGTSGTFPSGTYQSTNYWVDVVFTAQSGS